MLPKMKFCLFLPGRGMPAIPEMLSAKVMSRLATMAEDAGFDGVALDEHPAPPESWRTSGSGHDAIDPLVGLAGVAAATHHISLITALSVLPFRNPFVTAKAVATLDVLSEGRLILGVGAGYLEDEFAALGVAFEERNALFDEALDAMKHAWSGAIFNYQGLHFQATGIRVLPTPHLGRTIPIWVGGNSTMALRRVADVGHGWVSLPHRRNAAVSRHSPHLETLDELRRMMQRLTDLVEAAGRHDPHRDVVHPLGTLGLSTGDATSTVEEIRQLAEVGVTWVSVTDAPPTFDEAARFIEHYAENVIPQAR
jgi:probable F420-dependent oxidoreductase